MSVIVPAFVFHASEKSLSSRMYSTMDKFYITICLLFYPSLSLVSELSHFYQQNSVISMKNWETDHSMESIETMIFECVQKCNRQRSFSLKTRLNIQNAVIVVMGTSCSSYMIMSGSPWSLGFSVGCTQTGLHQDQKNLEKEAVIQISRIELYVNCSSPKEDFSGWSRSIGTELKRSIFL